MKPAVFVERQGYRQRRIGDAIRLLPVAGIILFALPILWGGQGLRETGIYVFVFWTILILLAWFLSRRITPSLGDGDAKGDGGAG